MHFLAYLAVLIVGSLIAVALAPKPPKQKAPTLEDFDLPTAEEGRSIPWVFGTYKITDPNFIWYGDLEVRTKTKDKVKTRLYRIGTQQEFCISPVDALVALEYGGKDCGITEVTASGQISINLPNLFGGRDKEGGIDGDFDVCFGEPTQAVNDYLLAQIGAPLSAFRDSLTLVGRKPSWVANSTYIKPLLPTVRCITAGWADGACWYPETAEIPDAGEIGASYDGAVAAVNGGTGLHYRWRLNTAFATNGSTEESVGTAGSLPIKREAESGPGLGTSIAGLYDGVTCGTEDVSVWFGDTARFRYAALTVPYVLDADAAAQGWTLGIWMNAESDDGYEVLCTNFDQGLSPSNEYTGIWLQVASDGRLFMRLGEGAWATPGNRLDYYTTGTITPGGRHFFALRYDPEGGFILTDKIKIYADGVEMPYVYSSGTGTGIGWLGASTNPRIAFGNVGTGHITWQSSPQNHWVFEGFADEPFLHLAPMSADDIANLYMVGACNAPTDAWDMNPAHMIYKVLTATDQGLAEPSATIDDASFRAAALTFYGEGLGLSTQWRNEGTVRDFLGEICRHAGAVISPDPRTGLTKLIPLRDDYDPAELDLLTEDYVLEVVEWQDAADGEAVNEVTVEFRERDGSKGSVTWTNRASVQQIGVVHETIAFPMISLRSLAKRVAKRECLQRSSNLSKGKIKVNRIGWDKLPGAVFRFSHAPEGIDELVVRVIDIDLGTLTDSDITISVVQDIFSLGDALDVGDQDGEWTAPDTAPAAVSVQELIEAPYWQLLGDLGSAETAALPAGAGYLVTLAAKPTGVAEGFNAWTRISPTDYAETAADVDFCPTATLTSALASGPDQEIAFGGGIDTDLVGAYWWVMIGSGATAEICFLDAFDAGAGTCWIIRGQCDTTPRAHAAGARLWFLDPDAPDWMRNPTVYTDGDVVNAKLQTVTQAGVLALASASVTSATLDARQTRPYPPGNVEINGERHPVELDGPLTVTWAHRDRVVQGAAIVLQEDATDYGPEAGTTYNAYAYDDADDTLMDSDTGISGATWSPTIATSCTLRIEIESVRDGYVSWQRQVRTFLYFTTSGLLTEAGDYLLAEDGAYLITET